MLSEGSCDTEDWNNHAENSALHQTNKLLQATKITIMFSQYYSFSSNKYSLCGKNITFFQQRNNLPTSNFWTVVYFQVKEDFQQECFRLI